MSNSHQLREAIGADTGAQGACKRSLLSVLDLQVVPQLLGVHESAGASRFAPRDEDYLPTAETIAEFARLCFDNDERVSMDFVQRLMEEDRSLTVVLRQLVAPAARHLGEQWDQDRIGFSQVTLGLLRMQNLTHHFASLGRRAPREDGDSFRIMVASAPGSQHLLGLAMVSELFASDGWDVRVEVATADTALLVAVESDWFDVLGLSVGLSEQLPALPGLVAALRRRSRNPRLGVLLGGMAFSGAEGSEPSYGADAVCLDPATAIRTARRLAMQPR